ncbi:MAG: sugar phosphate isomerase/epimerase [Candidatus Latescibacteria bacterium]|nr:sugar phosphate isomerase/epimerase [Candidatus Latescibacterota bacterium]
MMVLQNFEKKNMKIREQFEKLKEKSPEKLKQKLNLSWSNWGFGIENIGYSFARLRKYNVDFIELHGNRYGDDLGYRPDHIRKIASDYGITIAGICGMFSPDNDLSSNRGIIRQNAIDYIRRNVDLGYELGISYMLVVPGAVGRPEKIDESEFHRSAETLHIVADVFVTANIKAAIEPIRSAEVSFCHTVKDALSYIKAVDHPGVRHINGDVYHMQSEESHIGEAVLESGDRLVNLHVADSNRCALGDGSLDMDTLIMALYVIGYNSEGHYVTPEPLGPGGDPYPAMFAQPDKGLLDDMVGKTITYFREREELLLEA